MMAPLARMQFQGLRRSLSIKLLVTLVGVVCLGVALLYITPSHATPVRKASPQIATSGDGCNTNTFESAQVEARVISMQICINVQDDQVVSQVSVQSVNGSPCPDDVSVLLQDESAPQSPLAFSGCGDFTGPALSLQPNDTYFGHLDISFNNDDGTVDTAGLESSFLDSSS